MDSVRLLWESGRSLGIMAARFVGHVSQQRSLYPVAEVAEHHPETKIVPARLVAYCLLREHGLLPPDDSIKVISILKKILEK